MNVSNVMVSLADSIPSSMEGKISSPFRSTAYRLPDVTGGPSKRLIERMNCGSSLEYSRSMLCSTFFSPLTKFARISTTTSVTTIVSGMASKSMSDSGKEGQQWREVYALQEPE